MIPMVAVAVFRDWLTLTVSEFAEALGVDRSTVARWEDGDSVPPRWLIDAIEHGPDYVRHAVKSRKREHREMGEQCAAIIYRLIHERRTDPSRLHPRYAVLMTALTGLPAGIDPLMPASR
jgi:transcriptional regulator with XRE-family HTH domain